MSSRLSQLALNQPATLVGLDGARAFRRRLLELGLTPGVSVSVVSVAPLGDPLQIAVRGCHLSLRRSEAAQIRVAL